jgi:hypothetical protein
MTKNVLFLNSEIVTIMVMHCRLFVTYKWVISVHSTYANILKNIYKKVRKIVGIG